MTNTEFWRRIEAEVLSATAGRCPIEFLFAEMSSKLLADERLLRHICTNAGGEGTPVTVSLPVLGPESRRWAVGQTHRPAFEIGKGANRHPRGTVG
jgi:hypothetical protein